MGEIASVVTSEN